MSSNLQFEPFLFWSLLGKIHEHMTAKGGPIWPIFTKKDENVIRVVAW